MATNKTGRISSKPSEFAPYMQTTDDLQLSNGNPSTTKKWQNWGWTAAQSAAWTAFRNQSDELFPQWADKKHVNTDISDQMVLLIKTVKKFDNDPITGGHLLDKVALGGTISNCEIFSVKRGTALAAVSHQGASNQRTIGGLVTGTQKPVWL